MILLYKLNTSSCDWVYTCVEYLIVSFNTGEIWLWVHEIPPFGKYLCEDAQSCPTLCNPMDCSPPGSSVHGILQARVLEWVAISFSRSSSWLRDRTRVSCTVGRRFTTWATREVPLLPCNTEVPMPLQRAQSPTFLSLANLSGQTIVLTSILMIFVCQPQCQRTSDA